MRQQHKGFVTIISPLVSGSHKTSGDNIWVMSSKNPASDAGQERAGTIRFGMAPADAGA